MSRLLTVGRRSSEKDKCIFFLDEIIDRIGGLNLIVMPPPRPPRPPTHAHESGPPSLIPPPLAGEGGVGAGSPLSRGRAELEETLTQLRSAASPRHVWLAASMLYRGDDTRRL